MRVVGENVAAVAIRHPEIVETAPAGCGGLPSATRRAERTRFEDAVIVSLAPRDVLRNDDAP